MDVQAIVEAAGLALLATVNVGLWTLRVAVAAAGRRLTAAVIAGAEALLFALIFGTVISSEWLSVPCSVWLPRPPGSVVWRSCRCRRCGRPCQAA